MGELQNILKQQLKDYTATGVQSSFTGYLLHTMSEVAGFEGVHCW